MKTAAIASFLFAGVALAVPVAEKRGVDTEVVVTTIWTTTTVFVNEPTGAAFFERRPSTASSSASSSTSAPPPPSSAIPAPSVAPVVVPSAAPSVAAPIAAPVAAAAAPAPGAGALLSYTGEATYYVVSNGVAGSCGLTKSDGDNVVALSHLTMKNGANSNKNGLCGKTVNIQGETGVYTATIYDTCEGCAAGDIDLSPSLFKAAFPKGDGRVHGVNWWVDP